MAFPWLFVVEGGTVLVKTGLLNKLVALVRRKKKILLLGASGVGKTQFVRALKEDIVRSIPRTERSKFTDKTRIVFENLPFLFIDTPGHVDSAAIRKKAIRSAIRTGVSGIINVVSFGYHETEVRTSEAISSNGMPKIDSYQSRGLLRWSLPLNGCLGLTRR